MSEVPLFPGYEPPPVEEREKGLSADRRRTMRQREAIRIGIHPLAGGRIHLLAPLDASPGDPKNLPYRCGSCAWRQVLPYHNKSYPKCMWPGTQGADDYEEHGPPRVSHSASSDVRAWWPACRDYTPGDRSVSSDAARCFGDES